MRPALVLALALLLPACDRQCIEADTFATASDQSGSLRVALTATGEDGASYVLRDATLELGGPVLLTLAAQSVHEEALSTPLPAGTYSAFLRPSFRIAKLETDGSERLLEARLLGKNPQHVVLGPLEDGKLELTFAVGDQQLVFGAAPALRVTSAR